MALRKEDLLDTPGAVVVDFPVRIAAARRRRAQRSFVARRAVALALTLSLVGGVVAASAAGQGSDVASRPGAPASVVVEPGETLWDLALRYAAPGSDRTAYVDRLIALNDVSGVAPPGSLLELP